MGEGSIGVRHKWAPAIYTTYFGILNEAANKLGYALTIHGSIARDFDLVAIPWTDDCGSHEDLLNAFYKVAWCEGDPPPEWNPEQKPHGRIAYTISAGAGLYFDISIMPTASNNSFNLTPGKPVAG